jgi:4-amino-4-deoxy-L-arabinose transferase-like glycosyltransferase
MIPAETSGHRAIAPTSSSGWFARIHEPVLVFLLALAARLPHLGHVPQKDELNHVLAARSLLEYGTLEVVAGGSPYDRARGFTYLVAGVFRVLGESLVAGRLPALVAGTLLVVALFLWVRSEIGSVGGWAAALLLAFSPIAIMLSQWVRFYTIHALLFLGACVLTYVAMGTSERPLRSRVLMGVGAACCLALALHLQVLTVIGAAGLGLWVLLVGLPASFRRLDSRAARKWVAAGLASLVLVTLVVMSVTGFLGWLQTMATYSDLWVTGRGPRFYHDLFLGLYPTLWTLFPLALVISAASRWRATLLCASVLAVGLLAHSLAAWKDERYVFYLLPMFCAVWGMAAGAAFPWLVGQVRQVLRAAAGRPLPRGLESAVIGGVVAVAVGFVSLGNPAMGSWSVKVMTVNDADWGAWGNYRGHPDWVAAAAALETELEKAEVVLGSYDVTAVYALNRLDYLLRRVGSTYGDVPDFHLRGKTAVPVVPTPEALALVMSCHRSGLIFIERGHYGAEWAVTPELVAHLEAHAERLVMPEEWRLLVFRWTSPSAPGDAPCERIRGGA